MKVVRLSALSTSRLYPPGNIPGTHFCYGLSQPQGQSATGRIMSMKNSNDTIGNRTRDLPALSAVPQSTVPLRTLKCILENIYFGFRGECSGKFVHSNDMKAHSENRIMAELIINQCG